jgi:anti-sigma regulatory factor (Ser/Thr protein kinase)
VTGPFDHERTGELSLPDDSRSVAAARRFTRDILAAWHAERFEWIASQIVTELATNAVIHAGTAFTVRVLLDGEQLRLEVSDGSSQRPRPRHYDVDATTGRGLALIDRLARTWGTMADQGGKTVWCEIVQPDHGRGLPEFDSEFGPGFEAGIDGGSDRGDGADAASLRRSDPHAGEHAGSGWGGVRMEAAA